MTNEYYVSVVDLVDSNQVNLKSKNFTNTLLNSTIYLRYCI